MWRGRVGVVRWVGVVRVGGCGEGGCGEVGWGW